MQKGARFFRAGVRMLRVALGGAARADCDGAAWDAATGTVEWRAITLSRGGARALSFTLQIADDAPAGRAEITTEFLVDAAGEAAGFRTTRRDALNVGNYNVHTGVSRAQGGRIALSPDAALEFAAEALATDAAIETTVWSSDESLEFSFGPEMTFGAPVTLTVQLGERLSAAQWEAGVRPVLRYLPPGGAEPGTEPGTEPETVPSRYDAETGELVATLMHFSDYRLQFEVQAGRLDPWKLTPNLGSVSLFRGAVNYALPLALPARMSGGAPALAFAYSSAAADGGAMDDARLGVGWSFDVPHIRRGVKIDLNYTGPGELNPFIDVDDAGRDYVLELGGVSHRLIPTGTEVSGAQEYLTENSQPLRVVRCRVGSDCGTWRLNVPAWAEPNSVPYWSYYGTTLNNCWVNDGVVTPTVQYYWQAWTPDGTRYAFGTDAESTKRYWKRNNDANAAAYQTWYVTKVMNARKATTTAGGQPWSSYGLAAEYDYAEEPRQETEGWMTGVGSPCDSRKIAYDATTHVAMVTAGNLWMTTANAVTATFYYTGVSSTTDVRQRMTYADVMQAGKRVRRYVVDARLAPATSADYRVAYLVEQAWTNAGSTGGPDRQLPVTSFTYNMAGRGATERHVTKITNGYGGSTEYWYYDLNNGNRYVDQSPYTVLNIPALVNFVREVDIEHTPQKCSFAINNPDVFLGNIAILHGAALRFSLLSHADTGRLVKATLMVSP